MPSSPTARPTSPSLSIWRVFSLNSTPMPRSPRCSNASGCSDCSSRTSSSDPTRSPSDTASRSEDASPATPNAPTAATWRMTISHIAHCVGGVLSPLLCNVYLHRLDRVWDTREHGVLVRYCDDLVVMCSTGRQAEDALARLTTVLARLGLELKAAKTRIVHLTEGRDAEGFDFLGFHHRWVRARGTVSSRRVCFLARWPSRKATQHARDRIRELTQRKRLGLSDEWIVQELNQFLRGWGGYFRYGNSARVFDAISQYALERFAAFVGKRHKRSRRWGMRKVTCASPDNLGLITLCGTVIAPRPFRPWKATAERRR